MIVVSHCIRFDTIKSGIESIDSTWHWQVESCAFHVASLSRICSRLPFSSFSIDSVATCWALEEIRCTVIPMISYKLDIISTSILLFDDMSHWHSSRENAARNFKHLLLVYSENSPAHMTNQSLHPFFFVAFWLRKHHSPSILRKLDFELRRQIQMGENGKRTRVEQKFASRGRYFNLAEKLLREFSSVWWS